MRLNTAATSGGFLKTFLAVLSAIIVAGIMGVFALGSLQWIATRDMLIERVVRISEEDTSGGSPEIQLHQINRKIERLDRANLTLLQHLESKPWSLNDDEKAHISRIRKSINEKDQKQAIRAKEAKEKLDEAVLQVKNSDAAFDEVWQESSRRSLLAELKENDPPSEYLELIPILESQLETRTFQPVLMGKEREEHERSQKRAAELAPYYADRSLAQRHAVELLPAIGEAGTPENKEFVERVARYRQEKPDFFNEPDWPVRLAEEIKLADKENPPK